MASQTERPWLAQYGKNVPADIDLSKYNCLVQVLDHYLKQFAQRPAYHFMGKELSFAELDQKSRAFGAFLQAQGLKKGDKIALMMPNILQYPIALFGALRAGLIIVNTNPLYTAREMEHQFKDSGAKALVIAENFAAEFQKAAPKLGIELVITTSVGELLGLKGWLVNFVLRKVKKMIPPYQLPAKLKQFTFKQALASDPKKIQIIESQLDDTICIQYTGGTTGVAKGAELTNRNLVANMLQVRAWIAGADIKDGQEVMLTPLPMYHIFSFTVNCLCMASFGAKSVLVANPRDLPAVVKTITQTQPTMMTGVNTLFNALLNNEAFRALDFSKLKVAVGGAMAIQAPVAKRWREVTKMDLTEGYGMTESSPVACVNPLHDVQVGTIGVPIPSTWVRICDENLNELPIGERGEIQIKGPQVMKGYYNRPDETAKTITPDGWLRTGDIGIMNEKGFIKIVDRLKDMILVSGFNVYPNEVEEVIAAHPKVLEVAAVGVPDTHSGEAVKVYVVKKDESLTEAEVMNFCKENLTGYKKPKYLEFRTELPKTNVGKILRRALRDEAKN